MIRDIVENLTLFKAHSRPRDHHFQKASGMPHSAVWRSLLVESPHQSPRQRSRFFRRELSGGVRQRVENSTHPPHFPVRVVFLLTIPDALSEGGDPRLPICEL